MRGEKYIAPVTAALALAFGATACGNSVCESKFEATTTLPGGAKPDGVEIFTQMPKGSKEIEVGFTDPGGNWHGAWEPASGGGKLAMSIGAKAVQFGVRIKAAHGSQICGGSPQARFVQKPYIEAERKDRAIVPNQLSFQKDQSIHVDEIVPVLSR